MKWFCLVILLFLAGCQSQKPEPPKPETFLDRYNKNPELYNAILRKLHERHIQQIRRMHGEGD